MSHFYTYTALTPNSVARSADVDTRFMQVDAAFETLPAAETINQGRPTWCLDTGTANSVLLDMPVRPAAYVTGMTIKFQAAANNTGATTVNVMGETAAYLGVKQVVRSDGTALQQGDLVTNQVAEITYDGAAFRLAMAFADLSPAGVAAKVALAGAITVNGALAATGEVKANSGSAASTTALNPGLFVFGDGNSPYGLDLGYVGGSYGTRMFCSTGTKLFFGQFPVGPTGQSSFTNWATIDGTGFAVTGAATATGPVEAGTWFAITGAGAMDSGSVLLTKSGGGAMLNTPTGTTGLLTAGNVNIATWSATGLAVTGQLNATSHIKSSSSTGGVGYATGAGGTVTQATSKGTAVTLNKVCGQITMNGSSLAANSGVTFTLANNTIAAGDVVIVNIASGATLQTYTVTVVTVVANNCNIQLFNHSGGALAETIILNFAVIKAVTS